LEGIIMRRLIAIALSSVLALQGVPLLAASAPPALRGAHASGVQAPALPGAIEGTSQTATGEVLSRHKVQLRNLDTGQLAGTTTTNGAGHFSFTQLPPGNYTLELVNPAGAIVGSSAAIAVPAGATATVTVASTSAVIPAAAAAAAAAGGISTALVVTSLAVAAGIAGVVAVSRHNPSPSN
jgi:carboxypeptidase family protein